MTSGELLNFLTEEAKKYHSEALSSLERNRHMNDISPKDLLQLKRDERLTERLIDAVLVDFINRIGVSQGIDWGLYTKDL